MFIFKFGNKGSFLKLNLSLNFYHKENRPHLIE